jgi:hypothetical protein
MSTADILEGNIEAWATHLQQGAEDICRGFTRAFEKSIDSATELTGNVVNVKEHGSNLEALLAGLEKMDVVFDEDGKPSGLALMMHPDKKQQVEEELALAGPEFQARWDAIMARKREAWNASRSTRRLR